MSDPMTGHCLCGATQYSVTGAPKFMIQCHCEDCRRVNGAGSAPQISVAREYLTIKGPIKTFHRKSDAGNELEFSFCGDCGSPVLKTT